MTKADKEGQRKAPILRFKGFTDDWEQRKLGKVATFINGRAYKQNELLDSGKYKVLRVGNFYTNDSWYYSNLELADKYYIDKGDLVYTWSATFGPHIWDGEKVIYHYHIWKIELSKFLDRDFTLQILEADKAKLLANTNGSTMIHVTKKDMESKVISLPIIEEQKQIGLYLTKFDTLIALYERKKELLKKFQQGFSDILFKKNPKECVSLGDYFYFNKGKNIGNKDLINNGKYYAIVYGELYTTYNYVISKVFSKTSIKGFKGRKNDLLFPSSSTVPFGTATCSALEIDNIELGNDIIVARPKNTNELDSAFISYQINSKRKILYPIISGTTITHMYSKDLSKIRIWLPNITTQNYISNILQRISHLNILVDKKVNILKEIKKEFLNTMFI